jgi:heme exporter protein D
MTPRVKKMQWQSLDQFLHMGGYGLYVWGSYAVTFAVLAFEAVGAARRRSRALREAGEAGEAGETGAGAAS